MWVKREAWDRLIQRVIALEDSARETKNILYDWDYMPSAYSYTYGLPGAQQVVPGLRTKVDALLRHLDLEIKIEPAARKVSVLEKKA